MGHTTTDSAATATAEEVLLSVPGAELHKVVGATQELLATGAFTVSIVGTPPERVEAGVGDAARWPLSHALPVLKAAATIYSFALEHSKTEYLIVILPRTTPADVLEAVQDILHESCAFSTARQLDAAAEELDLKSGGKQAAALKAAEAAGQGPSAAAGAATAAAVAAAATAGVALPHQGLAAQQHAAAGPSGAAGDGGAPQPRLGRITTGKYSLPSSGNKAADKVAAGLLWGGTMAASAVGAAATATATAINNFKAKQLSGPPSQEHAKISPTFKRGLAIAGSIASSAAYVTGKLAELVGKASYATALAVARRLPGHGSKKATKATAAGAAAGGGDIVSPEERGVLHTVGAAGLLSFVEVYDSLEAAAKVVFAQSAEATTQYVQYKYGPEAGAAAAQSVPVAQDMLTATLNFSRLGARAFITKTAKSSAKVYLKSTVAGIHPEDQAAGQRLPTFAPAPAAGAAGASSSVVAPVAHAPAVGAAAGGSAPSPYPPGMSAAAAAAGGGGNLNTAAAQQAARAPNVLR